MDKKGIVTAFLLAAGLLGTPNVQAQRTYEEMEQLTVNEQVTTVITASEPVRFVDISTDKVVGDQPIDNIVTELNSWRFTPLKTIRLPFNVIIPSFISNRRNPTRCGITSCKVPAPSQTSTVRS